MFWRCIWDLNFVISHEIYFYEDFEHFEVSNIFFNRFICWNRNKNDKFVENKGNKFFIILYENQYKITYTEKFRTSKKCLLC